MIKIFRNYIIWLFFIVVLAGILRFHQIDKVPVSLYWDETASSYNSYSIAQTGRDEYGNFMPLLFRSFEDYKMPGNIYLTAISIKLFGLNEFSTRFSSAFLGVLTVLITYFLVYELFLRLESKSERRITYIALLTSFLLAISPWHIQFSRTGFEANVGLFFVVLGIWVFLKGLSRHKWYILSMFIFGISLYFYRSIHIFLPLMVIGLFIICKEELFKRMNRRLLFLGIVILTLVAMPIFVESLSKNGLRRAMQINVFTNSNAEVAVYVKSAHESGFDQLNKIFYNRRYVFLRKIIDNYFIHFGPRFLFINGDGNGRHGAVGLGLLYMWELPFLLIGIASVLRIQSKFKYIIFIWFALAPIPAALSVPSPHALRDLNVLPIPQLFVAIGIFTVVSLLRNKRRFLFIVLLSFMVLFFVSRYLFIYYVVTAKVKSSDWADGYKQLTEYVFTKEKSYDKIIISGHYWEPYAYFLFYKKYDPAMYQKYGNSNGFDKYLFGGTSWDKDKNSQELGDVNLREFAKTSRRLLVALSPQEHDMQKENITKITEIKNHNNETVFIVGEVK